TQPIAPLRRFPIAGAGATATSLRDGQVLLIAGRIATLFDPATERFTPTGSLIEARAYHAATLVTDGRVLLSGGYGDSGIALDDLEFFDPQTRLFSLAGRMTEGRAELTATLLSSGSLLIAGGMTAYWDYGGLASAQLFDPATGGSNATGGMSMERWGHTATLLPDGSVLVVGWGSPELYRENNSAAFHGGRGRGGSPTTSSAARWADGIDVTLVLGGEA